MHRDGEAEIVVHVGSLKAHDGLGLDQRGTIVGSVTRGFALVHLAHHVCVGIDEDTGEVLIGDTERNETVGIHGIFRTRQHEADAGIGHPAVPLGRELHAGGFHGTLVGVLVCLFQQVDGTVAGIRQAL